MSIYWWSFAEANSCWLIRACDYSSALDILLEKFDKEVSSRRAQYIISFPDLGDIHDHLRVNYNFDQIYWLGTLCDSCHSNFAFEGQQKLMSVCWFCQSC